MTNLWEGKARKYVPEPIVRMCDACLEKEAVAVRASACGPVSFAYCKECLAAGREPYGSLVAYIMCSGETTIEGLADWIKPIIRATLKAEGKTLEQFFEDVDDIIA